MYETDGDFQHLQALLNQSIEQAGTFLRRSFEMPEHSLSARQLVHLWQGLQNIALATTTKQGEPRVAPIGALLLHGHWYIPTVASAARTRHIQRQPAVSFTYYQGEDLAIIAHGQASIIPANHPDFAAVETFHLEVSQQSAQEWGEGIYLHIIPSVVYTYARFPDRHPEGGNPHS